MKNKMKLPINSYPGDGYYYITCAVCGKKMRAKDGRMARDIYKKNLIVCKDDYDVDNPQSYIKARKERRPPPAIWNRGEGADKFVVNDNTDRLPSAPKHVTILGYDGTDVSLQWLGPDDPGSGAIEGYAVDYRTPIGDSWVTLTADTDSIAQYYEHTISLADGQLIQYRVAAINDFGTGPYAESNVIDSSSSTVLLISEDGTSYILTEAGEYIEVE